VEDHVTTKRIVVVGSLNADLVVRLPRFPRPGETLTGESFAQFPGGKGANQACAAARLGAPVSMLGRVGADAHGAWLCGSLASDGVDVTGVRKDPTAATGVALIAIDGTGQNQIVIVAGANGAFDVEALRLDVAPLRAADVVLLQLETPIDTVSAAARMGRAAGAVVILDPAPARDVPDDLLRACDWVTPNESELAALVGAAADDALGPAEAASGARRLIARGARNVIVKMGARGALLVTGGEERLVASPPVTAVDTTAAGDCFNAAFAVSLSEGLTPVDAARFAAAAAAISVTRTGAQPAMPARDEVRRLLEG
jgi:ribokinase